MPPSLSPNWFLRKPDLFVIGAMKSGTSFLSRQLGRHPSIFIPHLEEPSYFVPPGQLRRIWPYMWEQGIWRSEEAYLRLFLPGKDAVILGEASTNYSKLPLIAGVPERIAHFTDAARFVYVMRDPIERSISHYWHLVRFNAEFRPIRDAIRLDPQFRDVSHYALQLAPYFARFGRDRIYTLTFEELTQKTETTMRNLYSWLGVDPAAASLVGGVEAENVTPDVVTMPRFLAALQPQLHSGQLRAVVRRLPFPVRRAAKRLATVAVERRHVDTSEVMSFLRPIQQRQTEVLATMLDREFPEWTTLYGNAVRAMRGTLHSECHTDA